MSYSHLRIIERGQLETLHRLGFIHHLPRRMSRLEIMDELSHLA